MDTGRKEPLASVIMPAYRCAGTIGEAVTSALSQNVELELVIIDDASPDPLEEVLSGYLSDSRVRLVHNEKNLGAAISRNRGVQLATGRYIAFLDADDVWLPDKLAQQICLLEETGAVLCCTAREMMTPAGKLTGRTIPVKPLVTYRELLRHNSINCSSVVMKREVALEFPMGHDDSHEDYITWLKILRKYGVACGINKPLLQYRLSNTGKSGSKLKSAAMTYRAYRHMGFGLVRSVCLFGSYAVHGVWKYAASFLRREP